MLATLKSIKPKKKSSIVKKGQAQASTLGDKKKLNKTTVVKKKEDKKKEKKNNLQKFGTKGGDSVIEGAFKTPKNKTQKKLKDLRKIEKNLKKTYDAYVKAIEDAQEFAVNEIDRKAGLKIHKERLKGVTRFKQWLDSWMHKEL